MAKPAKRAASPRGKASARPPRSTKQKVGSFFAWVGGIFLTVALLGGAAFAIVYVQTPVPEPDRDFQTNVSTVYYGDGTTVMGQLAIQNRVSIPLSEMPQSAKDAIVAAENATFWTDPGISIAGLTRAVISALGPGDTVGGSTITQQYVKVTYLTQDKTIQRKLKEIMIALKVGQDVPKEKILEGYLNTVYYGRGAYGIQAAAKAYYGIDAKDMTLPQSVALVSIINAPTHLDPGRGEKQAADLLERYQYTLNEMVKVGVLTEAEKAPIYTKLPAFPKLPKESTYGGTKGFLLKMVEDELGANGFSEAQVRGGGLKIITTIDVTAQAGAVQAAETTAQKAIIKGKNWTDLHPAIVSVDTATGGILAMYSGRDYVENNRDWARTPRETGSTFKTWALVAALRAGFGLDALFNGSEFNDGAGKINNAGGRNYGPVTLIRATTSSINSAYVDVVRQIPDGPNQVIKAANDAGIPSGQGWDPTLRMPLGNPQVSPLAAAGGYATLANGGKRIAPHIVAEVQDAGGVTTYKATPPQAQSIEPWVAQDATYALTNVTTDGTGSRVSSLGHQVAGKTGTKYDSAKRRTVASWFVGYTKQVSTAVMFVAGDSGVENLDQYMHGTSGGNYPAQAWLASMKVTMAGKEKQRFPGKSNQQPTRKSSTKPSPTPVETTLDPTESPEATPTPTDDAPEPTPTPTKSARPEPSDRPEPTTGPKPKPKPTKTPPGQPNGPGRVKPTASPSP